MSIGGELLGKHPNRFTEDDWQDARSFLALRMLENEARETPE